jgi:hypothetical protein
LTTKSNSELLQLAAKANASALLSNGARELQRRAGRVARGAQDVDHLLRAVVDEAKAVRMPAECSMTGDEVLSLQFAMQQVSYVDWEDLWNDAHPDRVGEALEGEDFQLKSVWRKKVRTMIMECHQEWMLAVDDADEYIGKLLESGASEEQAENLADWLWDVRCV